MEKDDCCASGMHCQSVNHAFLENFFRDLRSSAPVGATGAKDSRSEKLSIIDRLGAVDVDPDDFLTYERNEDRGRYEQKYPILQYLRIAEETVLGEIRGTSVEKGVRVWKMYNMGLLAKTPDLCFSIDFKPVATEVSCWGSLFDFSIRSHSHGDHMSKLEELVLDEGNPVYVPCGCPHAEWVPRRTVIEANSSIRRKSALIDFIVSKQRPEIPCLVSIVHCGQEAGNVTLMHSGDADVLDDMQNLPPIDFLTCHTEPGFELDKILSAVNPAVANLDHIMELTHTVQGGRILYGDACNQIANSRNAKSGQVICMTWGESMLF